MAFFVEEALDQEEKVVCPGNLNHCFSLATVVLVELFHVKSGHIA